MSNKRKEKLVTTNLMLKSRLLKPRASRVQSTKRKRSKRETPKRHVKSHSFRMKNPHNFNLYSKLLPKI